MAPIPKPASDTAEVHRVREWEDAARFERTVDNALGRLLGEMHGDFITFKTLASPLLKQLHDKEKARQKELGAPDFRYAAILAVRKTIAQAYIAYLKKNGDISKLNNNDHVAIIEALKHIKGGEDKPLNAGGNLLDKGETLLEHINRKIDLTGYYRENAARETLIAALMPYQQQLVEHNISLAHPKDNKKNPELKRYRALNDAVNAILADNNEIAHGKGVGVTTTDEQKKLLEKLENIKTQDILPERSLKRMLQENLDNFKIREQEAAIEREKTKTIPIIASNALQNILPSSGLPRHIIGAKGII